MSAVTSTSAVRAVIEKKRKGGENSDDEIQCLVDGFVRGEVDDALVTAWLMAVCFVGLSVEETFVLTRAMAHSGDIISWGNFSGAIVDKHSTGGVGDAVTLIAVPLAAASGALVAKLSGRALGHTGGTIDKLEAIPGFRADLSIEEFKDQVARLGCAIAAASDRLAPADKKMYALRDRTSTIASVPLIAASVLSKKIAAGAPAIVLDVKVGSGAFMRSLDDARLLGRTLLAVGRRLGRKIRVLITSMNEPLARSVGDALELDEALGVLEGHERGPLLDVAQTVAGAMIELIGLHEVSTASALSSGAALHRFRDMVEAQHGRLEDFDRKFVPSAKVGAPISGFVDRIDARVVGDAIAAEKPRYHRPTAQRVGVRILRRIGDHVHSGEPIFECFTPERSAKFEDSLRRAIVIASHRPELAPAIFDRIS